LIKINKNNEGIEGMPGTVRKLAKLTGRWESPFTVRLKHFVDLTGDDIETLRSLIEYEARVEKRRDLVVDGYAYSKLCFIKEGMAAQYKVLRNGKRQIVDVLVPGDVVGLPGSFLDRAPFSVIALTDMKLEVCSHETFVAACYRRPKFALALSWLAVQHATVYAERIVDIGRRTPIERLAHFLLELHARLMMVGRADPVAFDLPISQEVMSDTLGLSVPHLNRMLTKLRNDRMLVVSERRVQFTDIRSLEVLAHFQTATLARIPSPLQREQELIA
jgi:CRP-like cAMP-binding protein